MPQCQCYQYLNIFITAYFRKQSQHRSSLSACSHCVSVSHFPYSFLKSNVVVYCKYSIAKRSSREFYSGPKMGLRWLFSLNYQCAWEVATLKSWRFHCGVSCSVSAGQPLSLWSNSVACRVAQPYKVAKSSHFGRNYLERFDFMNNFIITVGPPQLDKSTGCAMPSSPCNVTFSWLTTSALRVSLGSVCLYVSFMLNLWSSSVILVCVLVLEQSLGLLSVR